MRPVERLDAERVADGDDAPVGVRDDEGVHAAQGRERLQVTVEGGLGVGVRGVAAEVQALDLAQFAVV
ncbi:hypothetical protein GCM10009762_06050 [Dermacoccus barathri]|uniref:Uncharacterized protein n=1 Tax=Dermacoccus barathri TaxID=322601 RepID=A0ABN2B7K8_9MICO